MLYLVVIASVSFVVAAFVVLRKVIQIRETEEVYVEMPEGGAIYYNIVSPLATTMKGGGQKALTWATPHFQTFLGMILSRLYKVSAFFSREFLKLHNFIQGKRVLREGGTTSLFIRTMSAKYKRTPTIRRVRKTETIKPL